MQVERLVRTEPDTFRQLGLDDLARKLQLPQVCTAAAVRQH